MTDAVVPSVKVPPNFFHILVSINIYVLVMKWDSIHDRIHKGKEKDMEKWPLLHVRDTAKKEGVTKIKRYKIQEGNINDLLISDVRECL